MIREDWMELSASLLSACLFTAWVERLNIVADVQRQTNYVSVVTGELDT